MELLVQHPVTDLRGMLIRDAGRRRRPTWPHGDVGVRPGLGEFQPGFGPLTDTSPDQTGNWSGRAQHVSARRAVRLPRSMWSYFRHAMQSSEIWSPTSDKELQTTDCRREFYGSSVSPRAFLQLRFQLADPVRALDQGQLAGLVDTLLAMPVRVATSAREIPLGEVGRDFAAYWRTSSTSVLAGENPPGWSVSASRPLCVLTVDRVERPQEGSSFVPIDPDTDAVELRYGRRSEADVWVVASARRSMDARTLQLHLSRLHSERSTFETLARVLALESPNRGRDQLLDSDKLQRALSDGAKYIRRDFAFGHDQAALMRAIESDLHMHAAQWDALDDQINSFRPHVRSGVDHVLQIVMGDNVMGDKFDNINSSTIVNRSAVQNAFNRLSDNSETELYTALKQIAEAVERLNDTEASDVAESLIEEAAGSKRRGVLAALWARLQQIAPVVSSLTGSAAVVTSLIA
ncbi:MAG TPA: hypothetical protein VFR22_11785 [Nocardioidaceae bacterium]|nr:hypothetical protein [Nocardioidaceae bacterium]